MSGGPARAITFCDAGGATGLRGISKPFQPVLRPCPKLPGEGFRLLSLRKAEGRRDQMGSLLALVDERDDLLLQPVLQGGHVAHGPESPEPFCRGQKMSDQLMARRCTHRIHVRREGLDVAELRLQKPELLPGRLVDAALTVSNETVLRDATETRRDIHHSAFARRQWMWLRHEDHRSINETGVLEFSPGRSVLKERLEGQTRHEPSPKNERAQEGIISAVN